MNSDMMIVFFSLIMMIFLLVWDRIDPVIILSFVLTTFLFTGIITTEDALNGFANEGVVSIALLFIIGGAIKKTNFIHTFVHKLLSFKKNPKESFLKILFFSSGFSSFLNNTPIVVILVPIIRDWCEKKNISPSKFLLPLSYATIFGGLITLVGTSTTLIIHGMMIQNGMKGFSMYSLAIIGIPGTLLGILYLYLIGYRLLPNHLPKREELYGKPRDYLVEVQVGESCSLIGKSIEGAKLRNLKGLYLIKIIRNDQHITPVFNHEIIQQNDVFLFTGTPYTIAELQEIKGLFVKTTCGEHLDSRDSSLTEAVVSQGSNLLFKTIKKSDFKNKYKAAVVAVHRNGTRMEGKVGDIMLKPGDTLLLLSSRSQVKNLSYSGDFFPISFHSAKSSLSSVQSFIILLTFMLMIVTVSIGFLTMLKASILSVCILIASKCVHPDEIVKFVQFKILLLIATSIGIGTAIKKSGVADLIAEFLLDSTKGLSFLFVLAIVYFTTNLFTEMMSNSATAMIMFPISMEIATKLSIDPFIFMIVIAVAASANFSTPIGYQTNLIVYSPGRYRFKDYLKVGVPLNFLFFVITLVSLNLFYL